MDNLGIDNRNADQPLVIVNPGEMFQDEARPGAMILGMDCTPKGRIWGCWTGTGDKRDGYFLIAASDDGGATWSKPRLAVGTRAVGRRLHGALVGNLWTDPRGRLWLFFDQQRGDAQGRITNWYLRCDNPDAPAPAWSEPVLFAEGCTLNKPTVLANGDWLLPVSDWHRKTARVFATSDEGAAWQERGSLQFLGWEFDEHMMVELRDGRIWMLARTKTQPFESFSHDHGATWNEPRPAATIQNINARFFLRRLTSGRILLVKNGSPTERLTQRTHLSAWLSEDEGQSWQGGLLLDERNAVSYPDGFEAPDGLIHILYDWNRHTDAEILLAKFREADLLAGKLVSTDASMRVLANKATGPKPEVLFNGIELSRPWPPPFCDPGSDAPMPVPYLENPPPVIPIDVGRQLFVDDFLIAGTTLDRVFHRPERHAGNPVLTAETPCETRVQPRVGLQQGGLFWHPEQGRYELFYHSGTLDPRQRHLAYSRDLLHWERPDFGRGHGNLFREPGPRGEALPPDDGGAVFSVWLDLEADDDGARYKLLSMNRRRPQAHTLHVSPDGVHWSQPVPAGPAGDAHSFFYNPFRRVWVYSIKREVQRDGKRLRARWYAEHQDFLRGGDWRDAVYWTCADRLDAPEPAGGYPACPHPGEACQLYALHGVAYESILLGMHEIHRGPENNVCEAGRFPKLTDLELGFSRDGFHWHRPDREGFIRGMRRPGYWDRAYLHATTSVCVVHEDRLVFPYAGYSGVAPDGTPGIYQGGAIGLATLRRDGFASMRAGDGGGTLMTRPLVFSGAHLFVNVDNPRGGLTVELLDEGGRVLPGYGRADCAPIAVDSTKAAVRWRGGRSLAALAGRSLRFRFTLAGGDLYAFWVSPSEEGRSGGYVAGGGPAFNGSRDM